MKKVTAVEWLEQQLNRIGLNSDLIGHLTKEAKEMEKQQIIDSHLDGQSLVSCKDEYAEQYYNQTYKK
jgi:hypothetical protein